MTRLTRIFISIVFGTCLLSNGMAQAPTWVATTPSTGTTGPITIPVNYGIDMTGTVYIIVFNYNYGGTLTSTGVRNAAISGPTGTLVATAVIPVTSINTVLQYIFSGLQSSRLHSIYIVAANSSGILQASPVKLLATTAACPKINIFTFFGNLGECVNSGAQGLYQVAPLGALSTGILEGTTWTVDWGDGSPVWTYTSTADDDMPAAQFHSFTTVDECAYVGSWTVENPCGEFLSGTSVFVVHGRDIPSDGDGELHLEEPVSGDVDITYVCEGIEHNLTLVDESTWNCQNPDVPSPLNPDDYDNDDPRYIQFVYGETPSGAIMNTITGNVVIGGSQTANASNGVVGSVLGPIDPPNPNTMTDVITIPATCQAGERFYVYIKNWNKCNPFIDESLDYVSDYFIIEVIDAPPAPIVTTPQTYCFDEAPSTISASPNLAGNTINWYTDASMTTLINTGTTTPSNISVPGVYYYYATETSGANGCEGPVSEIEVTVREELSRPGVISGPSEVCINAVSQVFSVSANPPTYTYGGTTEYYWTVPSGWSILSGQGTRQITVNIGGSSGTQTVRVVNRYTSNPTCQSPSRTFSVTVSPLSVGGSISATTPICIGSPATLTLTGYTGDVVQWERRLLPAATWTTVTNTSATYTYTPPTPGTWEFRALVQSGSCSQAYSSVFSLEVSPASVGGTLSGGTTPICLGSSTGNMVLSGYVGNITRWEYRRNGGSWHSITNTTNTLNHTPTQSGTYDYRVRVVSGACSSAYSSILTIVVNPLSVGGSISGGTTPICLGSSTGTMTLGSYTGTIVRWQRRLNSGSWTDISNTSATYSEIPSSAGTWEYRAEVQSGVCSSAYSSTRTIVVVPVSVGGSISGGSTPICPGDNTGIMTLSGYTGAIVRWEKRVDSGSWTVISNTAATYSEIPSSSGTWEYRVLVQNSPCSSVYSDVRTIIVWPEYDAQIYDDISICNNAAANLNIVLSGGTSPYTIAYTRNGAAQTALTGYISGTDFSTGILTTGSYVYAITSVTDASGCSAQSLGTSITVTVGEPLVDATITGNGDLCYGSSAWFSLTVNGGAPPFEITYTVDGVAQTPYSGYTDGTHINLGIPATGSHTVHIVSIEDACHDYVPTLPSDYSFSINAIPSAAGTVNNAPSICNDGTTDIELQADVALTTLAWTVSNTPSVTWTSGKAPAAGSGVTGTVISQNLEHNGTSPVTVTYSILPTGPSPTNCVGSEITRTVIVYPSAQVNDPADQTVCNNGSTAAVTFSTNRTGGTTTYSWVNDDTSIGLAAGGTGNIASFTATNAGTSPVTATITVTPSFEGCAGTPQTFSITVNPSAQVNDPSDQTVCNGGSTTAVIFSTNRTVGTTTYTWTNNATSIGLAASGTGNIASFTATNTGTSPVTATITVTPLFTYGGVSCSGTPETFTITVNPSGQVNDPSDQTVCNSGSTAAVTFSTNRTGGTTTYAWANSNTSIGLAASGTGNIASFTATNTGTSPVTATITVIPSFEGCTGTSQTFTITVNPSGQVNDPSDMTVCNGTNTTAVSFTTNRTGGTTTYSWANSNTSIGLAASGTGNIASFTATNTGSSPITGTITVTPLFEGCTGTPQTFTITVNPSGQVNDPSDQTVCSGGSTTAVIFSTNRTGGTTTYNWTNNNTSIGLAASGTGNIASFTATNTGTSPVTSTITVTPSFEGCTGTPQTFTITVNPSGQVNDPSDQTVCNGGSTTTVIFSTNRTGGTTTYNWTNNNTSIGLAASGTGNISSFTATNTGTSPVTATITVTPLFEGCAGTPQTFTITVNPSGQVNDPSDQTVCNGGSTTAVAFSTDRTGGTTTYSWTNNNTSIGLAASGTGNIASFTATNTGTSPVTATVTVTPLFEGCAGTPQTFTITVNPSAQVNDPSDQTVCNNASTTAIAFSTNRTGGTTTYTWINNITSIGLAASGSGNIASFTATNSGTSPVTATITVTPTYTYNGVSCSGTPENFTITVNPSGQVNDPSNLVVCNNSATSVSFSTNRTGGTTTYLWTNNNTSIGLAASGTGNISSFTATNSGTSPVTATITVTPLFEGCTGTSEDFTITVNPSAQVNDPSDQTVCNGGSIVPVIFSTDRTGGTTTYTWTNDDTSIGLAASGSGNISSFAVTNNGTSPVTATVTVTPTYTNGGVSCSGTPEDFTITVNPSAQVNDPTDQTVCNGGSAAAVTFSTDRTGGTTTYTWTNDNTSIGLAASGSGNITSFAVTNSGTSPVTATITVTPTFTNGGVSCSGTPEDFTITVNPSAQVNDPADLVVCNNSSTSVNFSTDRTGGTTTYTWTNNNTSIGLAASGSGNITSFTATNSGTSPVTATITVTPTFTNGGVSCSGTPEDFTITVNPSAQVDDPSNQTICNGGATTAVAFSTDRTGGTTTYTWTNNNTSIGLAASGSGNIASFAATNNGTSPVTATITVTPTFTNGGVSCSGSSEDFTITVNPSAQVNDPADIVVCNNSPASVSFTTDRTGGATTYTWTNNNTSIGLAASGSGNISSFTATNSGTSPVTATITVTPTYTNGGVSCSGTPEDFTITVNPSAQVNDPSDQMVCNGESTAAVTFSTDRTGGTTTYTWANTNTSIGLAASGTGNISSFTATNSGTSPVTATITVTPAFINGGASCSGTSQSFTITVYPTPVLTSTLTPSDVCSNTVFTYTPSSATTGTTFTWVRASVSGITPVGPTNGTGSISETLRNTTSAPIPVIYEYTLTANGCSNVQNVTVNIKPEPVISDQSASVCSGETLDHAILLDNFTNPADNVTFTWPAPVLSGGLSGGTARTSPSSANMTDVFSNLTGGVGTATYTVTPVYNGCTGDPKDIIVTIGSQPILDPGLDMTVCSNTVTGLELRVSSTSSPATSYDVYSITAETGLIAGSSNVAAANGVGETYLSNDSFVNETGVDKTVTYRVRPVFGATCIGDWVDVVVTVRPQPVILTGQAQTVCSNTAASLEIILVPANTPSGTTFSWPLPVMSDGSSQGTVGTGVPADPAGTSHITDIFENYGSSPITATYTVTPASSYGCAGTPADVVITVNPEPAAPVISGDNLLCTDQTSIVYMVTLHAGSTYSWTVPASVGTKTFDVNSNAIIINAASTAGSGTISVVETNSYGCSGQAGTFNVDVMAPSAQSVVTGDNTVCALETAVYSVPANTGSVYTWTLPAGAALLGDPSAATITVTFGTVSGTISVNEVNAAGCTTSHTPLTVTVRPLPTALISNSGTICAEGTQPVNITLSGTAPWTVVYAINGVTQSPDLTIASSPYTLNANTAGTYTIVSVTDDNLCTNTGTGNATVSYYPVPTASISGTTEICAGGTATLTISLTGSSPYDFTYSDGVTPVTVTGYASSVYTVAVTPALTSTYTVTAMNDNNGCQGTLSGSAVITVNPLPVFTLTGTNLVCYGGYSGAVDLEVTSGTAPYSFAWSGPGGFTAGTEDISGLGAGTYSVTVTDGKGCTASDNITLTQPAELILSNSGNISLLCNGATDGTGSFTASGGTSPYTFNTLDNSSGATVTFLASSVDITGAGEGTITIEVTDNNGCTAQSTITVTEPAVLDLTAVLSTSIDGTYNINCYGSNTGIINTTVTGGVSPYIYSWTTTDGSGLISGDADQTAITAGTYDLTVTDANGCTASGSWTLTQPDELTVVVTADDEIIGACASSVSQLNATVTGGVLPVSGDYTYHWTPSAGLNYTNVQSPVAKPSATTTYTVTITDRNGCTASGQITITVSPAIVLSTTPVVYAGGYNITCNGNSDGAIDLGVTGGELPYAYSWSGSTGYTASTEDVSGLTAGTYTVIVTDANGCSSTASVTLLEPAALTLSNTGDVLLSCYGDATGSGTFTVSGGTSPYTLNEISNDTGGSVTITGTSLSFSGAGAGTVTAGVTDANGCTAQASITVTEPAELLPGSIDGTQEVCYSGNPDPLTEVTAASGGPGTIIYQWERSIDGGSTWSLISGATTASYDPPVGILQTTIYRRRATSGTCDPVYSNEVTVTVNPLPVASISGTGSVCPGDIATVTVAITTGETPFTVVLSDGTTVSNYTSGDLITVNPATTTTYTIVTVTDNNGCTVTAPHANLTGSATITTLGGPEIAVQPVSVAACEDDAVSFAVDAGSTANPVYQWYYDAGSGMTVMSGETSSTLNLTAVSALNGYMYSVVISGDCPSPVTSDAATLTVYEKPEIIDQPDPLTLCAGEDAVFTVDAGLTSNPVYQWYVNSGSGWSVATGTRYQGANTATLTVVSVLEAMSGYQYMVRVSGSCTPYVESDVVTMTVTRQAEITQQPSSATVCENSSVTFTVNAGLTTNPSYVWEVTTDGGATWSVIPSATSASYIIASASSSDNGTGYRATINSTCGSSVTSQSAWLTVNELPEIVTQPADVTVCEYSVADFIVDAGVTTGDTYIWQRSTDGGVTWNNLTETATYIGVTSMDLKVNNTLRTMSGDQFRVIVSGTCSPSVTSDVVVLTVNYPPEILTQPVAASICENTGTSFAVTAQGTSITYQWYVDTGSGYTPVVDGGVYSGSQTGTLTLTNVPVSYDNYRYYVEITGVCSPVVTSAIVQLDVSVDTGIDTQPADTAICEFMTASFNVVAEGANLTYQWQYYDGSAWSDLTSSGYYTGVQTSTLMVFGPPRTMDGTRYRVVIGSDCSADITSDEAVLTVYTAPEISDHPDAVNGCPGGNAVFNVTATGTDLVYQWQVNSGSGFVDVSDDVTYSGTATDELTISNLDLSMNGYLVRVVISGSCSPSVTSSFAILSVYSEPVIMSEPADAAVCDQTSVYFYSQVYNTGHGETTIWQVNEGTGWTSLSDDATYQGTQTSQLVITSATVSMNGWYYRLEITGPCGLYYTREALLTVYEPPSADISPNDTILVCGGVSEQLHGNPAGGSGTYTAHRWYGDIGPLSTINAENPVFNTSMAGTYRLIYQVTDSNGCVGLDTLVVQVDSPVAMFTADRSAGCQPLTVNLTNNSTGYVSLLWDFGDGTTSMDINPTHIYTNTTSSLDYRTITLEVTSENGCTSTMQNSITVYPEILSDFSLSDDTICSGESVTLTSLPGAFRYYWNYGDGNLETGSNVINHVYTNSSTIPVTYQVILRTESFFGCTSEDTLLLVVYPSPVPEFVATPASQTYPDATVTFTNNTSSGTWSWLWNFDDGNTSVEESPVYTYADPGDYSVTLTASNGICSADVTHTVSVLPTPPIADFDSIPSGCMPLTITINNTSLYGTTYFWNFGDGYTSYAMNPVYTYVQAGTYMVTLTVTGPGGTDTKSMLVYVYQSPRAYFEVSPSTVYVNEDAVRFYNLSEDAETYLWDFGDGDTSAMSDPTHLYTVEGTYDVTLYAYSSEGCTDEYTMSPAVTVEPYGELVFGNVFMPNPDGEVDLDELPTSGDEMNQFFFPVIRETVTDYHLQIFNRWGTLIFETYDVNKPWNGYYRGKLCSQGVYVWYVEGKFTNGRPFKEAGDVTLLH